LAQTRQGNTKRKVREGKKRRRPVNGKKKSQKLEIRINSEIFRWSGLNRELAAHFSLVLLFKVQK
jgi:hypothetical protein